jgi:two-component system, NtrC family, response regulator AtoC
MTVKFEGPVVASRQESLTIPAPLPRLAAGSVSQAMKEIEKIVTEVAPTTIPVLILGESGTGKEMVARWIHSLSSQSNQPLERIPCALMTVSKMSEQLGRLSRTSGNEKPNAAAGTVLFDEISDLDPACQATLLHALPESETVPPEGTIASRVMSTTARDLDEAIDARRFRSELYYRINGVCLRLPPLRERKEDIPGLMKFLLANHAAQMARPPFALREESVEALLDYSWPGNIRELDNVARKIVVFGDERLAISELQSRPVPAHKAETATPRCNGLKAAARAASRQAERELIIEALTRTHWNRKRAAQELQISYKSLLGKLKQIEIE